MRFLVHGNIQSDVAAQIETAVSKQENLAAMIQWAMSQPDLFSPKVVSEVVIQDEFTHDVVVPRTDGLVLVYDTT